MIMWFPDCLTTTYPSFFSKRMSSLDFMLQK